jgi:hypothetical protein
VKRQAKQEKQRVSEERKEEHVHSAVDPCRRADLSSSSTMGGNTNNAGNNNTTTDAADVAESQSGSLPSTEPSFAGTNLSASKKDVVRGIPMPSIVISPISVTNSASEFDNALMGGGKPEKPLERSSSSLSLSGHHHHHHVHVSSTAINAGQPIMAPDTSTKQCGPSPTTADQQPTSNNTNATNTNSPTNTTNNSNANTPSKDLLDDGSGQILSPWRRNSLYNSFSQLVHSQKVTYEKNYRRDQIDSESQRSQSEQSELDDKVQRRGRCSDSVFVVELCDFVNSRLSFCCIFGKHFSLF